MVLNRRVRYLYYVMYGLAFGKIFRIATFYLFNNPFINHEIQIISREGRPAIHRAQTVSALRQQFGTDVLKVQIKERVAVSESAEKHCSVFEHGDSLAKTEFELMSEEILSRL